MLIVVLKKEDSDGIVTGINGNRRALRRRSPGAISDFTTQ